MQRRQQPLPLLVRVDVSGSMERYALRLLAFWHAATAPPNLGASVWRDVFAFGTGLTDLTPAFHLADTDAMLHLASRAINDFAGGPAWATAWRSCCSGTPGAWWRGARWCY